MSIVEKAWNLWRLSTLIDVYWPRRRTRPMAYLVDHRRWYQLVMDKDPYAFDPMSQKLFGWPVYRGRFAPPDGILFLPEETVRSMTYEPYEKAS